MEAAMRTAPTDEKDKLKESPFRDGTGGEF
jgi:hypothetical protein